MILALITIILSLEGLHTHINFMPLLPSVRHQAGSGNLSLLYFPNQLPAHEGFFSRHLASKTCPTASTSPTGNKKPCAVRCVSTDPMFSHRRTQMWSLVKWPLLREADLTPSKTDPCCHPSLFPYPASRDSTAVTTTWQHSISFFFQLIFQTERKREG